MEDKANSADTPDNFLKALAEELQEIQDTDTALADILKAHILKAAPSQNAVAQAKDAILKLADNRARPPIPEVPNE